MPVRDSPSALLPAASAGDNGFGPSSLAYPPSGKTHMWTFAKPVTLSNFGHPFISV